MKLKNVHLKHVTNLWVISHIFLVIVITSSVMVVLRKLLMICKIRIRFHVLKEIVRILSRGENYKIDIFHINLLLRRKSLE